MDNHRSFLIVGVFDIGLGALAFAGFKCLSRRALGAGAGGLAVYLPAVAADFITQALPVQLIHRDDF